MGDGYFTAEASDITVPPSKEGFNQFLVKPSIA